MFRINMYKIYAGLIAITLLTNQAQATRLFCFSCGDKKKVMSDMKILKNEEITVVKNEVDPIRQELQVIKKEEAQESIKEKTGYIAGITPDQPKVLKEMSEQQMEIKITPDQPKVLKEMSEQQMDIKDFTALLAEIKDFIAILGENDAKIDNGYLLSINNFFTPRLPKDIEDYNKLGELVDGRLNFGKLQSDSGIIQRNSFRISRDPQNYEEPVELKQNIRSCISENEIVCYTFDKPIQEVIKQKLQKLEQDKIWLWGEIEKKDTKIAKYKKQLGELSVNFPGLKAVTGALQELLIIRHTLERWMLGRIMTHVFAVQSSMIQRAQQELDKNQLELANQLLVQVGVVERNAKRMLDMPDALQPNMFDDSCERYLEEFLSRISTKTQITHGDKVIMAYLIRKVKVQNHLIRSIHLPVLTIFQQLPTHSPMVSPCVYGKVVTYVDYEAALSSSFNNGTAIGLTFEDLFRAYILPNLALGKKDRTFSDWLRQVANIASIRGIDLPILDRVQQHFLYNEYLAQIDAGPDRAVMRGAQVNACCFYANPMYLPLKVLNQGTIDAAQDIYMRACGLKGAMITSLSACHELRLEGFLGKDEQGREVIKVGLLLDQTPELQFDSSSK